MRQITNEESKHQVKWPEPADMVTLAQAVKEKRPYVELGGMNFSIRYVTHFGGSVFIRPADTNAIVPCGYFSTSRLQGVLNRYDR